MSYFDNKINEFVKQNEFYTHREILEKLNNLLIETPSKNLIDYFIIDNNIKDKSIQILINILTKYNIILHHFCYEIYNNSTDTEHIIKIAKEINNMGGIDFLSITHDILKYFSPYSNNDYGQVQCKTIEYLFRLVNREWKNINIII